MFGTGYQSNFPVRFLDAGRLLHSAQQGIYNPLVTERFVRKTRSNQNQKIEARVCTGIWRASTEGLLTAVDLHQR